MYVSSHYLVGSCGNVTAIRYRANHYIAVSNQSDKFTVASYAARSAL
jgi:hypothetical protein